MSLAFTRRNKKQAGGECGACSLPPPPQMGGALQTGGGCPCKSWFKGGSPQRGGSPPTGGAYKATAKNRKYLKLYKRGKSIGFTMTASLKAKGLIPRTSRKNKGKKVLGPKYK